MPILVPAVLAMAGIVYYVFDPSNTELSFPKCPFHLLTGYQCPACGIQRAFHCLMHGDIMQALQYNYFFIVSIPLCVLAIMAEWYNYSHRFDWAEKIVNSKYTLISFAILFVLWWILRNILGI